MQPVKKQIINFKILNRFYGFLLPPLEPALLRVAKAGGSGTAGTAAVPGPGRLAPEVRPWIITFFQTMFVNHVIIRHSVTLPYL